MTELLTRELKDIGFVICAKTGAAAVRYEIFEILGTCHETDQPLFEIKGSLNRIEQTTNLADAAIFAHGQVKWDGCSDWHFDIQDDCMIHNCNREDLERIGAILLACWDWTAELIPEKWSPD